MQTQGVYERKKEYNLKELKRRSIKPGFHGMFSTYVFTAHKENVPWKLKNLCGICSFSLRFIQSEDRSWRLIAFADSTGAREYTKSARYQSAIIAKGLINCLSLHNE